MNCIFISFIRWNGKGIYGQHTIPTNSEHTFQKTTSCLTLLFMQTSVHGITYLLIYLTNTQLHLLQCSLELDEELLIDVLSF